MPPAKTKKPFTPKLERFLATVAYDGTDHIGWQVQTGRLSIQVELEARMSRILKTPIVIHGSGRTDSGDSNRCRQPGARCRRDGDRTDQPPWS